MKNICSNRNDEYTGFRTLLASCKKRNKECDVDLPYLKCLWEKQEGKCAICKIQEKKLTKILCIDHNHTTGKIRKLLCKDCNSALGLLKENLSTIKKIINYINNYG